MFIGMTTGEPKLGGCLPISANIFSGGTMIFFALVTFIGLLWTWFFVPELAGKSLESIDAVFELPWYSIGRKGRELTQNQGGAVENYGQEKADVGMVEDVHVEAGEKKV